jgi:hypothetical protein
MAGTFRYLHLSEKNMTSGINLDWVSEDKLVDEKPSVWNIHFSHWRGLFRRACRWCLVETTTIRQVPAFTGPSVVALLCSTWYQVWFFYHKVLQTLLHRVVITFLWRNQIRTAISITLDKQLVDCHRWALQVKRWKLLKSSIFKQ